MPTKEIDVVSAPHSASKGPNKHVDADAKKAEVAEVLADLKKKVLQSPE